MKMAEAPRTPLRNLQPGGEESLRKTPGGLSMDIVLTPALRPPPPTKMGLSSPLTPRDTTPLTLRDITEKLSNAESKREERLKLRKENIDEKLATVQNKKEELINEKSIKVKEDLENKLKASEVNRELIIRKTKEDVQAYLSKVEQKVRDLEVTTEADKIVKKIAMDAEVKKVDQKRNEQLEKRIKELQDHEDYVKQVLATQEMKKKNYLASLERSLDKATKRKEDHLAKVVEVGQVEDIKVAEAREKRELSEKEMQAKTLAALNVKLSKVEEKQASREEDLKTRVEERARRAELVKLNKLTAAEGSSLGPESA